MLRKTYYHNSFKQIPVEPLYESSNIDVDADVIDPVTKKSLGVRKEKISSVKKLDEKSFVSFESADLYSIDNLQKVGIPPVVATSFIHNDLDNVIGMESVAEHTLNNLPEPEIKTQE